MTYISFPVQEVGVLKEIWIVDDDIHIGNMLEEVLYGEGYAVRRAYSGSEALLLLAQDKPDLILLDLMLPGVTGEEVLTQIKGIPVIVISAKVNVDDKVRVLLGGAVDYLTKPFHTAELLARIKAHLRTYACNTGSPLLTFEKITLDDTRHEVCLDRTPVKLTPTEYALLHALLEHPRQVITKSLLLDRLSAETPDCTDTSLKMHVSNLRRKLREQSGKDYIESVWGIGFKLREQ